MDSTNFSIAKEMDGKIPRDVAVDFGPKQSGWLINQLGDPS
jgi:hypothetical protein